MISGYYKINSVDFVIPIRTAPCEHWFLPMKCIKTFHTELRENVSDGLMMRKLVPYTLKIISFLNKV